MFNEFIYRFFLHLTVENMSIFFALILQKETQESKDGHQDKKRF